MKGCFTNPSECNNTECIDTTLGTKNLNYCCCRANMCNREHKWIPEATKPPEQITNNVPHEATFNFVWLTMSVSLAILVVFGAYMFFRHRKPSMFNEIPTVGFVF